MFEVYYGIFRTDGKNAAEQLWATVIQLPILIIDGISDEIFREAARIKSLYKMSLADSVALGSAAVMNASLVTADHHEFDPVEAKEKISFSWIR